jgi:hypothetical protein
MAGTVTPTPPNQPNQPNQPNPETPPSEAGRTTLATPWDRSDSTHESPASVGSSGGNRWHSAAHAPEAPASTPEPVSPIRRDGHQARHGQTHSRQHRHATRTPSRNATKCKANEPVLLVSTHEQAVRSPHATRTPSHRHRHRRQSLPLRHPTPNTLALATTWHPKPTTAGSVGQRTST